MPSAVHDLIAEFEASASALRAKAESASITAIDAASHGAPGAAATAAFHAAAYAQKAQDCVRPITTPATQRHAAFALRAAAQAASAAAEAADREAREVEHAAQIGHDPFRGQPNADPDQVGRELVDCTGVANG